MGEIEEEDGWCNGTVIFSDDYIVVINLVDAGLALVAIDVCVTIGPRSVVKRADILAAAASVLPVIIVGISEWKEGESILVWSLQQIWEKKVGNSDRGSYKIAGQEFRWTIFYKFEDDW